MTNVKDKTDKDLLKENEHNEISNHERKQLNFRMLRCNKVKNNPRVMIPKGSPPKEEVKFMGSKVDVSLDEAQYHLMRRKNIEQDKIFIKLPKLEFEISTTYQIQITKFNSH